MELGAGDILGKQLYGYMARKTTTVERVKAVIGARLNINGKWVDSNGYHIEDFDLSTNLMIAVPTKIVQGDFEACIKQIKKDHLEV